MFPHPISTSRRNCLERQSEDTHGTTHQMFLPRLRWFFLYLESTSYKGWICSLEFFVITTIEIERFNACIFKSNMQLALSKVYFIQCWCSKDVSSCTFCPIYDSDTNSTSLQSEQSPTRLLNLFSLCSFLVFFSFSPVFLGFNLTPHYHVIHKKPIQW